MPGSTFPMLAPMRRSWKTYPDVNDQGRCGSTFWTSDSKRWMQVAKGVDPAIRDATNAGFLAMIG